MNPLKKLTITAAAAIPAVAMFAGVANAAMEDHVVNGGFNINTKGWSAGANASIKKHDGFPIAVVTNEKFGGTASSVTVSQCMELYNGLPSYFEGRVMIPSNQERSGSAAFIVTTYSDSNCGVAIGDVAPGMFHTTQDWRKFEFELPSGAKSARVSMAVTKGKSFAKPGADFKAFFDDIKLIQYPLDVAEEEEDEDDCLCEPAAPTDEPAAEEPEPAAPTDDGPIPADAGDDDDAPVPAEPVGDDDESEEPVAPSAPADSADEPSEPAAPVAEPQAPAEDQANDDGETSPPAAEEQNAQDDEPAADAAGDEAETSNQYELSNDDNARVPGRGQTETPGAPDTGFSVADTKDMVGADELGIFGGVLAFFGLMLAAIAIKRERSNS